jgi:hypothetical protein
LVIFLAYGLGSNVFCQSTNFAYRPFPILLVHGFNTTVEGTWEFNMEKGREKIRRYYSTNITGIQTVDHSLGYDRFGPELMALYSPNSLTGNPLKKSYAARLDRPEFKPALLGSSDSKDRIFYPCFRPSQFASDCPNDWTTKEPEEFAKRYTPSEDMNAQLDYNHAYVEVYSPNFYNESDDGPGTTTDGVFPVRGASAPPNPTNYDITYGGQTQLLRIRIIQILNEYYGDWKWVGDTTAKIKIMCHSNGGLITTAALREDEKYWNEGTGKLTEDP